MEMTVSALDARCHVNVCGLALAVCKHWIVPIAVEVHIVEADRIEAMACTADCYDSAAVGWGGE